MLWNKRCKYCTYTHEITSDHISYIFLSYINYHIVSYHIVSYHIISYLISCHAMSCHIIPHIFRKPLNGGEGTHASSDPSIRGRWFKQIREAVKWFQAKNDCHYFRWSETHSLRFLELPANLWEIFELFFWKISPFRILLRCGHQRRNPHLFAGQSP